MKTEETNIAPDTTIHLSFGDFYCYPNYVIGRLHEGALMNKQTGNELYRVLDKQYGDRPYVYISDRQNLYAINPMVYLWASSIDALKGFLVVTQKDSTKNNTLIEKNFFSKHFEIFEDLPSAVTFAQQLLTSAT